MTKTETTLDVLRRIRNKCCKSCCIWCDWVELGSDPDAARHMRAALADCDPDDVGLRTSKGVRAMIHQAMRRCLAEGMST